MVNSIIAGIGAAINNKFGTAYKIYTERMEQDFEISEPCFFIRMLNTSHTLFLGSRYKQDHSFEIRCHVDNKKTTNTELNNIGDTLKEILEYIEEDPEGEKNLIRGKNLKFQINDGVLQFFVNYDYFVYREVEPAPYMMVLDGQYSTK